jgi:hypothetical protein
MMSSTARTTSVRLDKVVDDAVLAYAEWRHASAAVWDAYGRWESTAGPDHARGHAAYLAAIDQEQAAANAYADLIGRLVILLAADDASLTPNHLGNRRRADEPTRRQLHNT